MVSESALLEVKSQLVEAEKIDVNTLSEELLSLGFKCVCCGECCCGKFGDNVVSVFPFEIRNIMNFSGRKQEDVCLPADCDIVDGVGNMHTFGWVLKRRDSRDCIFLEKNRCRVYPVRPVICSTYPFFLYFAKEGIKLEVCECRGVGGEISFEECMRIALLLKERLVVELEDSIRLFDAFSGFSSDGVPSGCVVVHDSEGQHFVRATRQSMR